MAMILALWAWMRLKAVEWKLLEKVNSLWEKAQAFFARIGQKWRGTKTHAKLMAMEPLKRRMIIMLCGVFLLLGLSGLGIDFFQSLFDRYLKVSQLLGVFFNIFLKKIN
jgi:hypothetical protein